MHSAYPSVCRWNAVLVLFSILNWSYRSQRYCPITVTSQSETTSSKTLWYVEMFSRYGHATICEFFFGIEMLFAIFAKRSTTTSIIVGPPISGKSVIKSVLLCIHCLHDISYRCDKLCLGCQGLFVRWQLSHSLQYFLTSVSMFGQ